MLHYHALFFSLTYAILFALHPEEAIIPKLCRILLSATFSVLLTLREKKSALDGKNVKEVPAFKIVNLQKDESHTLWPEWNMKLAQFRTGTVCEWEGRNS